MKVLAIGNSYTAHLQRFLPAMAAAEKQDLHLQLAAVGGRSLEQHWSYFVSSRDHPDFKPYRDLNHDCTPANDEKHSLPEMLNAGDWDIITLQQYSFLGWQAETFEPYLGNFLKVIRETNSQARTALYATRSYRADNPKIAPGNEWGLTQEIMAKRITNCYRGLAAKYRLEFIPMGDAVQNERECAPLKYHQDYDPEKLSSYPYPTMPDNTGDTVGSMHWATKDDGTRELRCDTIHLNVRGEYLLACLWFAWLYKQDANQIAFLPPEISADDARLLRACAQKALETV